MGAVLILIILVMLFLRAIRPKEKYPYEPRELLTKREASFYSILAPIVDDLDLQLLVKLRLADIVGVKSGQDHYMSYFNKIKAKHTDFVICDPESLQVLVAIELDDPSHERPDRIERDLFVDKVYEASGIPLLHEWLPEDEKEWERFSYELEEDILDAIGIEGKPMVEEEEIKEASSEEEETEEKEG